jgi:hypothetical protein
VTASATAAAHMSLFMDIPLGWRPEAFALWSVVEPRFGSRSSQGFDRQ